MKIDWTKEKGDGEDGGAKRWVMGRERRGRVEGTENGGKGKGMEGSWEVKWEEVHGSARHTHTHTQRASGGPFHPVHFAHFNLLLRTIIILELFPGTLACRGHSCNPESWREKRPGPTFETVVGWGGGGGGSGYHYHGQNQGGFGRGGGGRGGEGGGVRWQILIVSNVMLSLNPLHSSKID